MMLDLTEENKELNENVINDTAAFTNYINGKLKNAGATYAIGGYGEHRSLYSRSRVFDAAVRDEEPRRLHLGLDIWGKPHTPVIAPLDGIVHSFAFNDGFGNYGTTIILTHKLDGISFYTLYGHLGRHSTTNLQEGNRIEKGEVFAEFGIPADNGQWPPHLHIQIIIDLEGWHGDYPGVCKFSEKDAFLDNCPDPDLIVQLNRFL